MAKNVQAFSKAPIAGSWLITLLCEPGARLSLRFMQPDAPNRSSWEPGEYELLFYKVSDIALNFECGNLPIRIKDCTVEASATSQKAPKKSRSRDKDSSFEVTLQFEEGSVRFQAEGFNLSPLREVITAKWVTDGR